MTDWWFSPGPGVLDTSSCSVIKLKTQIRFYPDIQNVHLIRDGPFNLQGGLWFFVSFRIFFSDNTRVRILIFLSCAKRNFFPEFNIRLYDKNSESEYFFFPPPKSEYFFQQHWESEYFFRKKTLFKLNGRSLTKTGTWQSVYDKEEIYTVIWVYILSISRVITLLLLKIRLIWGQIWGLK